MMNTRDSSFGRQSARNATLWLVRYRRFAMLFASCAMLAAPAAWADEAVDRLKARVHAEYPRLDPQHGDYARLSEWDKVRMLREFSYRHTAYSNHVDSQSYKAGAAMADRVLRDKVSLTEAYEFFDQSHGGVVCGHAAALLQRLFTAFGFDAWTVGHGFYPRTAKGSSFTHTETLVRIADGEGSSTRTLITLHDPSTNLSYTRADGKSPLDYFELLKHVAREEVSEVGTSGAIDDGVVRSDPATVCLADETDGRQLNDYLGSWNIHDQVHRLLELDQKRWRVESAREFAEFDRLGNVMWKPELINEGRPGKTIYIHCFPFDIGGGRSDCKDLLARAKETVVKNTPTISKNNATKTAVGTSHAATATPFPLPGEWVQYRGNRSLDGHVQGRGKITKPTIAWKQFVGRVESTIVVEAADDPSKLKLAANAPHRHVPADEGWQRRWFDPQPQGTIEGREQPLVPSSTVTYADILPDVSGMERVEFASGFALPTRNGEWQYGPGSLAAWKDGKWQNVWQTKPVDHCFSPYPLVGDFDHDGQLEIAVLPWRALQVYDARTGVLETECKFTEGRSYGFFGAFDLDSDGISEFVVLSDFAMHVEVLGYRDGQLKLLWKHEIQLDISDPRKIFHVLPDPVVDIDGDGHKDLVLDLYNDTGDAKWHTVVRDGLTGAVKSDLIDEIAQGTADLDRDGSYELLTVATVGRHIPEYGTIRVRGWRDGELKSRWETHDQGWCDHPAPIVLHCWRYDRHAVSALVRTTDQGQSAILRKAVADMPEQVELCVANWKDAGFERGLSVRGPHLKSVALDKSGALLAETTSLPDEETEIAVTSGRAECVASVRKPGPLTPPLVMHDGRETQPLLVAAGAGGEIVGWHPPREDQPAKPRWRRQGTPGPAPIAVRLRDDGQRQILHASRSPHGYARLSVADALTGDTLWKHDFPRFAASGDSWNPGGFISWYAGNFTDTARQDVLVTLSRSMMHGEETFLVSGEDGHEIWHRPRQIAHRSVAGPFAVTDFNGDGHDDAASFYPSIHYILDGPTGRDLLAGENRWKETPIKTVYWGRPVALSASASQEPAIVFASTHMVGLVRRDGSLAWSDAYDKGVACLPAVGDFDGDGRREMIFAGFADGVRCYDVATGAVKWSVPVSTSEHVDSVVAGDINGDGRDEAMFAVGNTLHCISATADGRGGQELWRLQLPSTVSAPAIASVGADSKQLGEELSILVTGADGYVYCIE